MIGLFALGLLALVHAYVVYPLSMLALARLRPRRSAPAAGASGWPSITLVISAYNEERVLREKLENVGRLDYPADRLRAVVVSDGSTDGTEAIAREYAPRGIALEAIPGRHGKVACLNRVLPRIDSDLVVMSDANSLYERDSLRRLAAPFADGRIGCVCGELAYRNPKALSSGEGERAYWGYERWVKRTEGSTGSLLGANGAIYAFRAPLFRAVDPLMFCDDVIPVRIRIHGWDVIYEPGARCVEEAVDEATELRRRRRHASFGLRSMLALCGEAAAARRPLVVYQCVSHRILRWFGGLWLALILIGTLGLPAPWRAAAAALQGLLYGAAAAGYLLDRLGRRVTILYFPFYALAITAAGMQGLASFILRTDRPWWEPRQ